MKSYKDGLEDALKAMGPCSSLPLALKQVRKLLDEEVDSNPYSLIHFARTTLDLHRIVQAIMFSDLMEGKDDFDTDHPEECQAIGQKVNEILTILETLHPRLKSDFHAPTKVNKNNESA